MRWRVWLLLCCLLPACSTGPVNAPVGDRSRQPARIPSTHIVGQGDTLYSVAFLYGKTVEELAAWNGIRQPYTIFRGQKIRLAPPKTTALVRRKISPSKPKPRVSRAPKPATTSTVRPSQPKVTRPSATKPAAARPATRTGLVAGKGPPSWTWPASGKLIRRFDPRSTGKKGIDIAGKAGSPVRAAAAGKVVYAGSGLSGYGRLIIIKHNKDFLSAYAHNRKLVAKEGQWVKKGELIARMGSSATDRTELHFEIRKKGQPVDPLRYLPKR
ncbi:lipoprotein NlpD [Thiogranum longum]|uniref:Lipoprotein NlpD n=1 Tax=Thiogranum longum TaxID=1537524 RepID=A0A4R1HMF0_9GAMM|nr:peptidoglycan DD-metalloendopeptidase family protein [Thiogranum longum]TCK18422.1 lipoprotein NlpD [Thiogranum longum]